MGPEDQGYKPAGGEQISNEGNMMSFEEAYEDAERLREKLILRLTENYHDADIQLSHEDIAKQDRILLDIIQRRSATPENIRLADTIRKDLAYRESKIVKLEKTHEC